MFYIHTYNCSYIYIFRFRCVVIVVAVDDDFFFLVFFRFFMLRCYSVLVCVFSMSVVNGNLSVYLLLFCIYVICCRHTIRHQCQYMYIYVAYAQMEATIKMNARDDALDELNFFFLLLLLFLYTYMYRVFDVYGSLYVCYCCFFFTLILSLRTFLL